MSWFSLVRVCCWLFEAWMSSECGNTVNWWIQRKLPCRRITPVLRCNTPNSWHVIIIVIHNFNHELLALCLKSLGLESSWLNLGVESPGLNVLQPQPYTTDTEYGNTGCGIFKRGCTRLERFLTKNQHI